MAHSEIGADGVETIQFLSGTQAEMADKFSKLSLDAFNNGAVAVKQRLIYDNEPCPCGSEIRFDLCCKKKKMFVG